MRRHSYLSSLGMTLILLIGVHSSYGIDAGPTIPNNLNTISQYCSNGTCSTGPVNTIPSNYTYQKEHLPVLLINWSQTCENMFKNHISGCTPVEQAVQYDTSNQYVSGKLVKQGNDTIRTSPQVKNNWLYYKYSNKEITCVHCYFDITSTQESKQIIIESALPSFVDQSINNASKTYKYFNERFMQGCDVAVISSMPGLLNDTIHYMLSGCTKTSFNGTIIKPVHVSSWDYNNPFSTLHQVSYLKIIMHGHLSYNGNKTFGGIGPSLCINGKTCNFKDPYAKEGY